MPRYVADRLTKAINLIGDPILGVQTRSSALAEIRGNAVIAN